jgi:hypothetical protein
MGAISWCETTVKDNKGCDCSTKCENGSKIPINLSEKPIEISAPGGVAATSSC